MSRRRVLRCGVLWLCLAASADAEAQRRDALRTAEAALAAVDVEGAAAALASLKRQSGDDANVLHLDALLQLHLGDYEAGVEAMRRSLSARPPAANDERTQVLSLLESTRDATAGYESSASEDGRYLVRHAPGRDAHLVPYALEAMQRADEAISEELGVRVPGPIRLEIYPNARTLAAVSTLSEEAIERTGTIALCKWDRLMVTSPRALLRGYPWMDTISHEMVHLILTRASGDRAPVWVQEGVAKFLESRWRGEQASHLRPAVAALLARRVRAGDLIPFERLHPSIALLPSQEDAALAFAQVSTFVERYYQQYGREGLQQAIGRMAEGSDARDAFAGVAGRPWQALERDWKASLRSRSGPRNDAPDFLRLRFAGAGDEAETEGVSAEAKRRLRLGDLLWARRRYRAAAVEYGHAHEAAPDDPLVASRLGRAALAGGAPEEAVAALTPLAERYPEHAPTWAVLSAAQQAMGAEDDARASAVRALRLNPFDPQPHCVLARVAEDEGPRALEARQCRALGGTLAP